jgi:putative tricarboxylic transport membrane protein
MVESILSGLSILVQPTKLLGLLFGTLLGIVFGIIPGLNSISAVVLVLPFTMNMDASTAMIILFSSYCGAMYGGSVPAILFKVPGTAAAMMTTLDGYALAQKGQAGEALALSALASGLGGLSSALVLILLLPVLSDLALAFGPGEYLALAIFGLSVITSLGEKNQVKSVICICFGILISCVGVDNVQGSERFTFGIPDVLSGFGVVPVFTGLLAFSELFRQAQRTWGGQEAIRRKASVKIPPLKELVRLWPTLLRGSIIGNIIGILPGEGSVIATALAYNEERRWLKDPGKLGTGIYEGVVSVESANNAVTGSAMVPTLALGIPGSPTAAVLMGAFYIQGIYPGPHLMYKQPEMVNAIFVSSIAANILILIFGLMGVRYLAKVVEAPYTVLGPMIAMFCIWGTYSVTNSLWDVWVMLAFSIIGYFMAKYEYPVVGVVLGMILGPLTESSLAHTIDVYRGNWLGFFGRPMISVLLAISLFTVCYPFIKDLLRFRKVNEKEAVKGV